ncbi:hypothetical protein LXL04_023929 [Taraxacum kok-saghyz]
MVLEAINSKSEEAMVVSCCRRTAVKTEEAVVETESDGRTCEDRDDGENVKAATTGKTGEMMYVKANDLVTLLKNVHNYIDEKLGFAVNVLSYGQDSYNMSNMAKLEFPALEVNGKNYMSWTIDAEMHLESMGIREAINFINDCSLQDKARAHVFLRKHIDQL